MDYVICNGELYHHGTKGMKWGVRRYQNKDGSLTPAGKKRYNKELQKLKDRETAIKGMEKAKARTDKLNAKKAELDAREKALRSNGTKKSTTQQKPTSETKQVTVKSVKNMSDDELRRVVNRLNLEQQYRNLNPEKVSTGKKFVNSMLDKVLIPAASEVGKNVAKAALTKAATNLTGLELGDKKKDDKKK